MTTDDSTPAPSARGYTRYGVPSSEGTVTRRSRWLAIVALVVAGLVLLVVVITGVDYLLGKGKIHRGVSVYGVPVGGLTPQEASQKLRAAVPKAGRLVLTDGGKSWTIAAADVGARIDGKQASVVAFRYTRHNGLAVDVWRRFGLWFSGHDLEPAIAFERAALNAELDKIAGLVEVKPRSAAVLMKGAKPVVRPGREGLALDRAAVERQLARAVVAGKALTVDLPVITAAPAITTADARDAADGARAFLNGPLTLTYKDRRWKIPAAKLAGYLTFVPGGSPKLRATLGSAAMEGYFRYLTAQIGTPAKDATFRVSGTHVKVVPGKFGIGVAEKPTVRNIEMAALQTGGDRTAKLVIGQARPELTYTKAKALKITTRIGTYTTSVAGTSGRLANVALGASMLSDSLVKPGAVFSVNETTGERTAAKGFQVAPVIINGKLEDSLGGGMCQVSTTLFNAAFEAGLQIVERHNHSLYISHYPLGRDATVSYGAYDLKIRNDTEHWVLVKSFYSGGYLTFSLYSAPLHRKVTSSVSGWYDYRPFPVVRKKDPTLKAGQTSIDTAGVSGRSITCYRKVYDASGKLLWNDTFKSVYSVVPQVVLVGTKKPSPSPSSSGSSSPSPSPSATKKPTPTPSGTH